VVGTIKSLKILSCRYSQILPETYIQRQAALHDCLPRLLGDGNTNIEKVYIKGQKKFCTGPSRAAKAEKNILYRHDKPNELTKQEGPHSLESPFTSVSTASRGHLSLVSLDCTVKLSLLILRRLFREVPNEGILYSRGRRINRKENNLSTSVL